MIKVYSDCGSYNNGRKDPNKPMYGSYGTIVLDGNDNILYSKSVVFDEKTNNYCELLGMIDGLAWAVSNYPEEEIEVYSDSQYVIYGARDRLAKWVAKGWKNSEGPVKNKELWEIVWTIQMNNFNIEYIWVRGHQGKKVTKKDNYDVYYQEMCDTLAVETIQKRLSGEI